MNLAEIPNDADGDAMRRVISSGSDPSRPMVVDFAVAVPNEEKGNRIKQRVQNRGYSVKIYKDEETKEWTCYCSREMILDHALLLSYQKELDELAQSDEGFSDGWGTYGNNQG